MFNMTNGWQPTGELARRWHVSEGDAEISKILVGPVVHGGQVLPLLDRAGEVHLVQGQLVLPGLVRGGEAVVVVDREHQGLVERVPGHHLVRMRNLTQVLRATKS